MLEIVPLFDGLSPEALAKIESRAVARNYPRNAVVISEGDEATSMFIIVTGSVKVYHTEADGKETILNTQGPGQHFGELALVDDAPRSASVMTQEPSRLLVLSKAAFKDCLEESPEIGYHLVQALARQVRRLTETVNMMGRDVYGRIRTLLESLAIERDGMLVIEQAMTQQDIGNRIASSREMVSRVFKELKSGGYIEEQDKRIIIRKKLPLNW
jgi:CRP/FNR family transcriptional regulator, cyclic AMP receptor protein